MLTVYHLDGQRLCRRITWRESAAHAGAGFNAETGELEFSF
jgi:hypothetical protein